MLVTFIISIFYTYWLLVRQEIIYKLWIMGRFVYCTSGVPQGSVLGRLLFAIYISPVDKVAAAHGLRYHQYADDTQLYMAVRQSVDVRRRCCSLVPGEWSELLNPAQTETVLFGTSVQWEKVPTASGIDDGGTIVPFRDTVNFTSAFDDSKLFCST